MNYIRDRKSNIPFSLHDSKITQLEINESNLSLKMDRIFQGWIWQGDNEPLFAIMRIWNTGDMIYRIK